MTKILTKEEMQYLKECGRRCFNCNHWGKFHFEGWCDVCNCEKYDDGDIYDARLQPKIPRNI